MIICLDGPNGSGKTKIAQGIKKNCQDVVIIDDFQQNELVQNKNYVQMRKKLQKTFDKNKNYILIRWLASLYVFDFYGQEDLFFTATKGLVKPDYNFIVLANEDIIQKRLSLRKDFSEEISTKSQIDMFYAYSKIDKSEIVYNNNDKDLKIITKKICSLFLN